MHRGALRSQLCAQRWRTVVRKFFGRLCVDLAGMYPPEGEIGFMDTEGIQTGATWQETLGGKLQVTPILVPVFSPSFFAGTNCGQEVQAFIPIVNRDEHGAFTIFFFIHLGEKIVVGVYLRRPVI